MPGHLRLIVESVYSSSSGCSTPHAMSLRRSNRYSSGSSGARSSATTTFKGLRRALVEVSRSGAARRMISRHKIQQNTARIDRTAMNVVICRDFLRAVLLFVIAADGRLSTVLTITARLSTA
jgi:hypothetical protein